MATLPLRLSPTPQLPMYDFITIGSATRDVFVRSRSLEILHCDNSPTGEDACFPLGAKIEIDELVFETGGGATNTAATFGRLGRRAAALTAVGGDANGRDVLEALRANGVSTALVQKEPQEQTAYSIITLAGTGERTILVYRGASEKIRADRIPWPKLRAKWFYITSLGGEIALLEELLGYANKNGIRVAWNPGAKELKYGLNDLAVMIRQVDIFNLNVEEAMQLTGARSRNLAELRGALRRLPRRAFVITDGGNGAYADDGCQGWHSGVPPTKRINSTGAGDAFGSGLVAGLDRWDDLPKAMAVGTLNAAGVVQHMGAKKGLFRRLPTAQEIKKIPVRPWK